MEDKFWKGRKILITGYEGFLGSHLTRALLNNQAQVWGLDIKTYRRDTIISLDELKRMSVIKGSVENLSLLINIIKRNNIEFIFHLAARALVSNCLKNPVRAFSTNIKGTWNILEAVRVNTCVKSVVIASSDKAYGDQINLPYKETFPLAGRHPYDVSKSCADLLANAYYHSYDLPVSITRCGNIFGPGDFNFSRIIPDAIKSAILGETLFIRSNGKFVRDYIYVSDIVEGYLKLAKKIYEGKAVGESFNFSNEKPMSVLEIVELVYKLAGKKPNYKILNQAENEIKNQFLSSRKAEKILGWKPHFKLAASLKNTIEWYRGLFT
ncbi:MAG: GDP-mannose 4,6-dehydratase [Candidatus Omnitrophota bacterium]